jgi:tetratricopeptide (TPR) repeat protein
MSERNAEAALEIARRAVALDDKDPTAHAVLGRAYSALGDHEPAIAELREAVRLNPNLALAHYGLGLTLVVCGKPREAIPELDAAQRLSPHDPYLWSFAMFRAWAHLSLGDFEAAIEDANLSVRQPRAPFPAWGTLASTLGHLGRIEEGRAALSKAHELEPRFSTLGFIHEIWPNLDSVFSGRFYDGLRMVAPGIPDPRAVDRTGKASRES